jgi:hypothetical protein
MAFPALLAASLALPFAGRLARLAGGFIRRRPIAATAIAGGAGLAAFGTQQALTMGGDGQGGLVPRRRRKRALTADDMRTALTIASAISKKAAENFILQRTRR